MIGEKTDKRRIFTPEEKKQLLKDNHGICAHCGKKLTLKTMTVEHIIPLSRGGKNEPENLTILCKEDNKRKGDLLYLPAAFYTALRGKPRYEQMQKHMVTWFETVKDVFDLERYPLIGPETYVQINPVRNHRRPEAIPVLPQLMLKWSIAGSQEWEGLKKETGLDIWKYRDTMRTIVYDHEKPKKQPIPVYALRKETNGKLLALAFINYQKDRQQFTMSIPWHNMTADYLNDVIFHLAGVLAHTIHVIGGQHLKAYYVMAADRKAVEKFLFSKYPPLEWGVVRGYFTHYDEKGAEDGYTIPVQLDEKGGIFEMGELFIADTRITRSIYGDGIPTKLMEGMAEKC